MHLCWVKIVTRISLVRMKRNSATRASTVPQKKFFTRSTTGTEDVDAGSEKKSNVDLSRFQIEQKHKLSSSNPKDKPQETQSGNDLLVKRKITKRQHVSVAYDSNFKTEKEEQDPEGSSGTKPTDDVRMSEKFKVESHSNAMIKDESKNITDIKLNDELKIKTGLLSPHNWEAVLQNLREMRKDKNAPVDSMGCDKCVNESATPKDMRFQSLLSLMLSSQTKDQVTYSAMLRLREHGCSVEKILNTSEEQLGKLIYPVGFWKTKVKYIMKTARILKEKYDGDIPNSVKKLCKLPGVGPKMSHLCMKNAWGEITGIGVDTHVHRITNRLGWVVTKTPEETRKTLEGWLPKELWIEVNDLLVGFGQQVCRAQRPQCATCLNYNVCPYGVAYLNKKSE